MVRQFLFVFSIVAVAFPRVTFAAEFVVGDGDGWTTSYDYEGWAKAKEFRIGDQLVFKYNMGSHSVYQVDEDAYKKCNIPRTGGLSSGNDVIALDTQGPKYFVCGVGLHCLKSGQKLAVDVKQGGPQSPTNKSTAAAQSLTPIGSPNAAPVSQSPTSNDSPKYAPTPESLDAGDQQLDGESPPPPVVAAGVSPPPKSNGIGKTESKILMTVVVVAMTVLVHMF